MPHTCQAIGAGYVSTEDISNTQKKVKKSGLDSRISQKMLLEEDLTSAERWLENKNYLHEVLVATAIFSKKDKEERRDTAREKFACYALVFVAPHQLKILSEREYFTLFDSTHKANDQNFNLFTFTIRDSHDIWITGTHALVQ